jgi:hypothetical protein
MLLEGKLDEVEAELNEQNRRIEVNVGAQLMAKLKEEADSTDHEDFASERWGDGTSKVIANHYNTMHDRRMERAKNSSSSWKK